MLLGACKSNPYEQYARAVRRDVDQSAATLALTTVRLQSTVVHGRVPVDSARVWSTELARSATTLRARAADLAKLGPPDLSMASVHEGLLGELNGAADTLASLGSSIGVCAEGSQPPARQPKPPATGVVRSREEDSLAALDARIDSEARATADSVAAACRASVGDAVADLKQRMSYMEDELRWTRQRAGRQLTTHGVLLGDVTLPAAK
jgi:hypothetical protein